MSVSAIFGTRIAVAPKNVEVGVRQMATTTSGGVVIECSSRPQKKATAHHMKSRPKKTQPWDIRRRPTVYEPLPPLPPDWTFVSSGGSDEAEGDVAVQVEVDVQTSSPPLSAPLPADS